MCSCDLGAGLATQCMVDGLPWQLFARFLWAGCGYE